MTPVRTHTKICGLRDPDTARVALDAGADLVGVVFAESRRRVDVATALAIREVLGPRAEILDSSTEAIDRALDDHRPLLVGVFAKQTADEINRIVAQVDLDLVQLSGGEHPSITARLQRPVIRAGNTKAPLASVSIVSPVILERGSGAGISTPFWPMRGSEPE